MDSPVDVAAEVAALRAKARKMSALGMQYFEAASVIDEAARVLAGDPKPTVLEFLAEATDAFKKARVARENRARAAAASVICD